MNSCMFVVPSLSDGGAERVVSILSSELAHIIEKVYVLTYWDTDFNYPMDNRVCVINLSGGDKYAYERIAKKRRVKIMREIIRREAPDVIVPFLPQVCLQVGIATLGMECNIIQTIRNDPKTSPGKKTRRLLRDFQIRCARCTIVQNEEQLNYFPPKWRNKIHILPNPISKPFLDKEYKGSEKFKAVSVGRLIEQKNFTLLIDAFSEFVKKHPDATLSIYGDGALKNALQKQILDNKMNDNIFLKGRSDCLQEILANSSVFIMSSDFEGMPNSLMEAMAVGIPVISTDCPTGPKELIGDNERGYLVETGNVSQMAMMIEDVYQNYEMALKKSLDAKETVRNSFGAEIIAQRFLKIADEVLGK